MSKPPLVHELPKEERISGETSWKTKKDLDGRQQVWRGRYGEMTEPVKSVLWLR